MSGELYKRKNFEPNFNNLLRVLKREIPARPTLFEFFTNDRIITKLTGEPSRQSEDIMKEFSRIINFFTIAGYDYTTISGWRTNTLSFPKADSEKIKSRSLNTGYVITDRQSFENYEWPDAAIGNYELYSHLKTFLPDGMKLITSGNGGLLENVIDLVGFENLSMMMMLDEDLTTEIFDSVGSRLLVFYKIVSQIDTVGACIVNDDWGFKNQIMFSPDMMKRWVFPWHKKIVEVIHSAGKPAILHSCGQLKLIMDEIIDELKYDGKHSFEDQITPVEEAYKLWGKRIAVLGGIDMDFLARQKPEDISTRSKNMLIEGMQAGGYALGSGNSVPEYIPDENYLAMISVVNKF